jgi:hypothetical protein
LEWRRTFNIQHSTSNPEKLSFRESASKPVARAGGYASNNFAWMLSVECSLLNVSPMPL